MLTNASYYYVILALTTFARPELGTHHSSINHVTRNSIILHTYVYCQQLFHYNYPALFVTVYLIDYCQSPFFGLFVTLL